MVNVRPLRVPVILDSPILPWWRGLLQNLDITVGCGDDIARNDPAPLWRNVAREQVFVPIEYTAQNEASQRNDAYRCPPGPTREFCS